MYNVYDQIVLLLLRLARRNGKKIAKDTYQITVHLTNSELANMIGSSRETISRTLTKLKKENIIKLDVNGFLIIHYTTLEETLLQ